jgi:translation initiation factor IF-3
LVSPAFFASGQTRRDEGEKDGRSFRIAQQELRVNDRIRIPRVRVVGSDGSQIGILDTKEALAMAMEQDLDLVEVAPQADPPVCRIMDYGKYKYEQAVQKKEARKKQSLVVVKEMKMRPKIDTHDYETKKGHVIRFLQQGAKVKMTIMFRGRETVHPELGQRLLDRLAGEVSDIAKVDTPPKLDGRNMTMVLSPHKDSVHSKPQQQQQPTRARRNTQSRPPKQEREAPVEEEQEKEPVRPIKITRAEGG